VTFRIVASCLIAFVLVVGAGGCGSMQGGSSALLDQVGGSTQIKALSDAFVNNAASDPRSSKLLSGANLGALKTKVSDQFCATLGGGCAAPLTSAQVTEAAKKVDAPTSSGLSDSLMKALDSVKASPVAKETVTKLLGPQLGGIVAGLL
jgi:Bacterial-like globin